MCHKVIINAKNEIFITIITTINYHHFVNCHCTFNFLKDKYKVFQKNKKKIETIKKIVLIAF